MTTKTKSSDGLSRRGFIAACGAAAAATALPAGAGASAAGGNKSANVVETVKRWYQASIDEITQRWEQRFRHRQYRPDAPDEGDWEDHEAPRMELECALGQHFLKDEEEVTLLALVASTQAYDVGAGSRGAAETVMALDVLAHAERLGYFAEPCPEALRFPPLPTLDCIDGYDDFRCAEQDLETAQHILALHRNVREGVFSAEHTAEAEARLAAAEKNLAAIRSGTIPAFTEEEKLARHEARRREIVLAYKATLEAAGDNASWVEVPPFWQRLAQEARS